MFEKGLNLGTQWSVQKCRYFKYATLAC